MEPYMIVRALYGAVIIAMLGWFAIARGLFLYRLITSGQAAGGREETPAKIAEVEVTEVLGQKKLLKWSIPGIAHVFVFLGFLVLGLTVVEAFGELFIEGFAFPIIGTWPIVRFLEDLFAVLRPRRHRDLRDHPAAATIRPRRAASPGSSAPTPRAPGSCSG